MKFIHHCPIFKSIVDIKEADGGPYGGTFLELIPYIGKYKERYSLHCL